MGDPGESELSTSYDAEGKWMERKKQGVEKREPRRELQCERREREGREWRKDWTTVRAVGGEERVGSRIEWFWLADQFHTLGPPTASYPSRGIWPFVSSIFPTSSWSSGAPPNSWPGPFLPFSRCFTPSGDHDIPAATRVGADHFRRRRRGDKTPANCERVTKRWSPMKMKRITLCAGDILFFFPRFCHRSFFISGAADYGV